MEALFDWRGDVEWATRIVKAILEADSPRISDIAEGWEEPSRRACVPFTAFSKECRPIRGRS